jgi:hypothetical protein
MSFTPKKQKKITRFMNDAKSKFNFVFIDLCFQYTIIFIIALFFDRIAKALTLRYQEGLGLGQIIICAISLFQTVRYWRMVKK